MIKLANSIRALVTGLLPVALLASAAPVQAATLDANTQFYVPKVNHGAFTQMASLKANGQGKDAHLIWQMVQTPHAIWFTHGTPKEVKKEVRNTVNLAAGKGTVPVLVAYNIPYRDCSYYSAGGAAGPAEYEAWIDGFAAGIGDKEVVVILEPDGLGIIPWYNPFADRDSWVANPNYEWCQPDDADPITTPAERFAMLHYAVNKLKQNPGTSVYLDGTHSAWLGANDSADRLIQAGVADADGFFLNVSNFVVDERLEKYGQWVAKCIAFGSHPASWGNGHTEWCASQYYPSDPNDFSSWTLSDQWYTDNVESQNWWYSESVLKHFVIDSSRNGQGPWVPSASYPEPQDWCNPPDRGLGVRPSAATGGGLLDAYLWIKIPGESDGECTRGLGAGGVTVDPEWGLIDPRPGDWFPEFALDLVHNANPAIH